MIIKCSNCGKEIKGNVVGALSINPKLRNMCISCANKQYKTESVEGVLPEKHSTGKTGEWEKEFDKKFKMFLISLLPLIPNRNIYFEQKQFISDLLQEQKQEIIQMKKHGASNDYGYDEYIDGYNQAIDDVIEEIKNK